MSPTGGGGSRPRSSSAGRGLVATETLMLLSRRRIPAFEDLVERDFRGDFDGGLGELVEIDRPAASSQHPQGGAERDPASRREQVRVVEVDVDDARAEAGEERRAGGHPQ